MEEFKPIQFDQETQQKYWEGASNKFSRYITYVRGGFDLFNETWKYLATILSAYWTIKAADYWHDFGVSDFWLTLGIAIASLVGVGILGIVGRWNLYKLSKAREFATTQYGSVTKYDGFNMNVQQVKLLRQILNELKQKNENNSARPQ